MFKEIVSESPFLMIMVLIMVVSVMVTVFVVGKLIHKDIEQFTGITQQAGDVTIVTPTRTNYIVFEYKGKIYEEIVSSKAYRGVFEGDKLKVNAVEHLDKEGNILRLNVDFNNVIK